MLANRTAHNVNDNAMMHFRNILKRRQKLLTLDKFLVKNARKAIAEEEESTVNLRHRRETTPKGKLPSHFMYGGATPHSSSPSPSLPPLPSTYADTPQQNRFINKLSAKLVQILCTIILFCSLYMHCMLYVICTLYVTWFVLCYILYVYASKVHLVF